MSSKADGRTFPVDVINVGSNGSVDKVWGETKILEQEQNLSINIKASNPDHVTYASHR